MFPLQKQHSFKNLGATKVFNSHINTTVKHKSHTKEAVTNGNQLDRQSIELAVVVPSSTQCGIGEV